MAQIKVLLSKPCLRFFLRALSVCFLLVLIAALPQPAHAAQVTLGWNPCEESDLDGYLVFQRRDGQAYDFANPVWLGTETTCTISELEDGATYYFVVRSCDIGGNESVNSNEVMFQATAGGQATIRVNAGGNDYVDVNGNQWLADYGFNTGITWSTNDPISGTEDDPLFQTERWDNDNAPDLMYQFTVPNGSYTVNLYLADIYDGTAGVGLRQFDVRIEGELVFDNIDIYSEVGHDAALIKTSQVDVFDGQLNIEFLQGVENPKIAAIEIVPATAGEPQAPVAVAGADTTAAVGATVNLDGSQSSDPDGTITSYQWTQTAGPSVTLTNAQSAQAGFVVPPVTRNTTFTFALTVHDEDNLQATDSCSVTVDPDAFALTASAGTGGTIAPAGTTQATYGSDHNFSITANAHYHVADVTVDGQSVGAVTSYTFSNVSSNHTIAASFAADVYTLSATAGSGGVISPAGDQPVTYGGTMQYTITADANHQIADVTVDGVSVGAVATYTFTDVDRNHTIAASFTPNTYTITSGAGVGGTVTPAGAIQLPYGASQQYTITPDTNYQVADVTVDGVSVGAVTTYTFNAITGNHTLNATFAPNAYVISASATAGGTVAPAGDTTVVHGQSRTFTFEPEANHHIEDILVDGQSVGAVTSYTFTDVSAPHTVLAQFAPDTFTITADAGVNGTIAPSGAVSVVYGETVTFNLIPDTRCEVEDVLVDGQSIGPVSSYTFSDIAADHQINVTFAAVPAGDVLLRVNAGGDEYVDADGNLWQADTGYNTGQVYAVNSPISGTSEDYLYQTERWDHGSGAELTYGFNVPDGQYRVNLHFANIYAGTAGVGERVFDVLAEGELVLNALDIYAQVGHNAALVETLDVVVNDGRLDIELRHGVENPKISAIEIMSTTPAPEPVNDTVIRVNTGGPAYTDADGNVWEADYGFNTGRVSSTNDAIDGTTADTLFRSERWDEAGGSELRYAFDLPDGQYRVNLYFADIYSGTAGVGQRVFDVLVEGDLVLDDLDIFSEVGHDAALIKTATVTVVDGQMNIEFQHGVENPKIAAIEILGL